MLVGKKASLDGSTIVDRDEDYDQGFNEKCFVYYPAKNYDELFVSKGTGVEIPLKGEGCGFTAVRDAVEDYGRFDEQGINSYNVAMSSAESEASNCRVFDGSQ
ncbi:peptidase U34 [Lactobacillus delbrueckii subsp. lactis]|nr:peptidase U34 [Lactobacillus delbrueckii subsp. lactis]